MSVVIKGMDMPTDCKHCRLMQNGGGIDDDEYWCALVPYLVWSDGDSLPDYRMDGCPLEGVDDVR